MSCKYCSLVSNFLTLEAPQDQSKSISDIISNVESLNLGDILSFKARAGQDVGGGRRRSRCGYLCGISLYAI